MKDFTGQIAKNNDYKPSFGKAKPVKIDINNVDSVVSTNIDNIAISAKTLEDHYNIREIEGAAEALLKENEELRKKVKYLETNNRKYLELNEQLEQKIVKQNKIINEGSISSKYINLTKNAKRMLDGIEQESIEKGCWVRINRNDLINKYGVHNSFFAQAKEELIQNNLVEYKMDYFENSKKKSSFYRSLVN